MLSTEMSPVRVSPRPVKVTSAPFEPARPQLFASLPSVWSSFAFVLSKSSVVPESRMSALVLVT